MVCHWSRMRPVFSRSGRAAVVSVRSAGISGAMKRALKSLAKKPPSAKKRACGSAALPDRPLHRRHRVEIAVRQRLQRADVEVARALVLECRERRVLAKNIRRRVEAEGRAEAEAPGDLAHDPPIGLGLAGRGKERALPRDAPFRIGHGAGFLAPGLRRQQHMRAHVDRVIGNHILGNDEQFELLQRVANAVGVRQRHRRIGTHHPQRLDLAARDGLEHLDRLQPLMGGDARRLPEPAHAIDVRRRKSHMGGELVGEPADLAAAHRIGLPGQRERRRARLADPPRREMAVDDGVDLVGALRRLVDALRIQRDDTLGVFANIWKNAATSCSDEAGRQRGGPDAARDAARAGDGVVEAGGVERDVVAVEHAVIGEMDQQPAEQRRIGARLQPQEQIVVADGIGPARIDHDHPRAALLLVGEHALVQHRMAPGRVGADQHQKIRLVEIFIAARHRVGAEGAAVARNGRGHAEPRIGVDIGAADKALHQLVGDVVILRQQLAGEIERDRARAVARDDVLEAVRDMVERVAPGHPLHGPLAAADHRIEQAGRSGRASRRAPSPSSTAGRNWRDASGSPDIAAPPRPSGVARMPQPTPQ